MDKWVPQVDSGLGRLILAHLEKDPLLASVRRALPDQRWQTQA